MALNTPIPSRAVHFGSPDIPNSPSFELTDENSQTSEGSLEFLNAQLIAHGFTSKPGLCLDGAGAKDVERVVRCILGLLGQRMQDVSRAEAFSSNLRTLTYEHERMKSMHKSAIERADNAEREANIARTKLATSMKTLNETITAHKSTTAELTRTRTLMQGIRATHAAELRKRDKVLTNFPPNVTTSSLTFTSAKCLNSDLRIPQDKAILEAALEDAEKARRKAINEIRALREVVQDAVNGVNRVATTDQMDKPYYTAAQLFPISPPPPTYAAEKLENAFKALKDVATTLKESQVPRTLPPPPSREDELEKEINSMATQLESLKTQLAESNQRASADSRALLERFDAGAAGKGKSPSEVSVDLMTVPQVDEAEARLNGMRNQLEAERTRFTEACVKLGEDRAAIEVERRQLLEEKRKWETEKMLSDLPPTPLVPAPVTTAKHTRKPERIKKLKSRSSHNRRSSIGLPPSSPNRGKVSELAYETEVVVNMDDYLSPPDTTSKDKSLLPDAFILPPPSPRTSWPPANEIDSFLSPGKSSNTNSSASSSSATTISTGESSMPEPSSSSIPPKTPSRFPIAKPLARNMSHAYSPVKPSPLSRILMLGGSPDPSGGSLEKLDTVEEAEWEEEEREKEGRGLSEEDLFPPVERASTFKPIAPVRKMPRKVNSSSPTKPKIMPIRTRTTATTVVSSKPLHLSPKKARSKEPAAARGGKVVQKSTLGVDKKETEKPTRTASSLRTSSNPKVATTKVVTGARPARKGWS